MILDEKKKQRQLIEEQHIRFDRLMVSVEGHGDRFDAFTTGLEALK